MACTWQILCLTLLGASSPTLAAAQAPPTSSHDAVSQSGRRTMAAVRLDEGETIVLDGRLDEPAWSRAIAAANFRQQDPDNGTPATEATEVRVVYTHDTFFMGVICHDSEPEKLIGFQRRRDEALFADDRFMWAIDTFLDGRTGYFFEMNPAGLMGDALLSSGKESRQWDGIWDARVERSAIGYTIEVEIPFRTLNFSPGNERWGINFQRTVRRKNEESLWSGWLRNQGLLRLTNAGLLTGIRDVGQGYGLEVKPYGLVGMTESPGQEPPGAREREAHAGLDVSYSVTPSLRAMFTAKTDFAQTEVDQRQLNLTRFSLFFPERRSFFLDGSPFFELPTVGPPPNGWNDPVPLLTPFFSRRIGLNADGTPTPINVGAKLIGQAGAHDIGLLHVQTENQSGLAGDDFTVARLKRRLLLQSHAGLFYTRRAPRAGDGPTLQTVGGDLRLATSQFRGSSNLELIAYFLKTPAGHPSADAAPGAPAPADGGRNAAFGAELSYPNDRWSGRMAFREVQERFDPSVGFVLREGYRMYAPSLFFGPRPAHHPVIRRVQFGGDALWLQDVRGTTTLLRTVTINLPGIDLHSGDSFQFQIAPTEELLDSDFHLGSITLPAGRRYRFTRYRLQLWSAGRRPITSYPSLEWGGFYSGTRTRVAYSINLRLRTGLLVLLSGEWNRVMLPEGEYRTRLYRLVGETQFSPSIALVNNVQYDSQTARVGWQSRFRWILEPGNDLYIVYTHNWIDDPVRGRFQTIDRNATSKIIYTRRF